MRRCVAWGRSLLRGYLTYHAGSVPSNSWLVVDVRIRSGPEWRLRSDLGRRAFTAVATERRSNLTPLSIGCQPSPCLQRLAPEGTSEEQVPDGPGNRQAIHGGDQERVRPGEPGCRTIMRSFSGETAVPDVEPSVASRVGATYPTPVRGAIRAAGEGPGTPGFRAPSRQVDGRARGERR